MKKLFLFILFALLLQYTNGQQIYQRLFENHGSGFTDMVQNPDSTYTILGTIDYHFYLVKINGNGNILWEKFFRPSSGIAGSAKNLFLLPDGYLVTGIANDSTPPDYDRDFIIAKADTAGNPIWLKKFNSPFNDGGEIIKSIDGNFFISFYQSGYIGVNPVDYTNIIKLNNQYQIVWAKKIEHDNIRGLSMMQLRDSCIVSSTQYIDSVGKSTYVLLKYDLNGNAIWQREIITINPGFVITFYPQFELADGTIICTGHLIDTATLDKHGIIYLKTDANGFATSLINFYPINTAYVLRAGKVFEVRPNLYALMHNGGILLIDSLDNIVDEKLYQSGFSGYYLYNYFKCTDSTYFFIGAEITASGCNYLVKTDTLLTGACISFPQPFLKDTVPFATTIKNFTDSVTFFTESFGFTISTPTCNKYLICNTATDIDAQIIHQDILSFYPNPFNQYVKIKNNFSQAMQGALMDVTGKVLLPFTLNGYEITELNTSVIQPGIYFIKCETKNMFFSKKIIKLN